MTSAARLLAVIACLLGAAGVAAAAGAAHGGGEFLAPAAQLLMAHAVASLALAPLIGGSRLGLVAIAGLEAGSILFAADMAMRTFAARPLFPMAAPSGGSIVILSWLVAALACAVRKRHPG
jgi:uncharacterized membrane protein YgdD (TMEM256/DUF423 family)